MKTITLIILLAVHLISYAQHQAPQTVNPVELDKYLGRWYDIASYSAGIQEDCRCTTLDYEAVPGKKYIRVYKRCVRFINGKFRIIKITGKAYFLEGSDNTRFKVWYHWPMHEDYCIVGLADDYSWAVVCHPSHKYLRILYREAFIPTQTYNQILSIIEEKGFDTDLLVKTSQHCDIF